MSRGQQGERDEGFRSAGALWRFTGAGLVAATVELGNYWLGIYTAVPTLEPLPVVAFLAGVLLGWPGIAGCVLGQMLFRVWLYDPLSWFQSALLPGDAPLAQWFGIPLSYASIGVAGYLTFRFGAGIGRGFPNARSYLALMLAAGSGGALTALSINLQFTPSWRGFLVHSASNFVSILLLAPPVLLVAESHLRRWLVEIPSERRLARPFPANLELRTREPEGEGEGALSLGLRLVFVIGVLLAITVAVVALTYRFPQIGGWPLLGYLGPVVWMALHHGLRGALLATSLSGVFYLSGRSIIDRDLLPDDPDLYAVGLYADFVVFSLVGVFLGSEREEETRLRSELEGRAQQMTLLNEMGDLLQASVDAEEAYGIVDQRVRRLFPAESGALAVRADSSDLLEVVLEWGGERGGERVFAAEDCWALRRGQVHAVVDRGRDPVCRHACAETAGASLCVPLVAQGETLGVLHLADGSSAQSRVLSEPRRELAVAVAKQVALALGNLRLRAGLRDQSIRDPLTGLFNRRYLAESLERERARAERQKLTFGVILIDLDHFKVFNDEHGHEAGDMVLHELGRFLHTRTRREDIACRYGGEEFVVLLAEASLESTRRRAEELRHEVQQLRLSFAGKTLGPITMSFGIAAYPEHGTTDEAILRAADAALYRAKAQGRDRVVAAESTEPSQSKLFSEP